MKMKALFLFFISSLLTSSWTDDQHLLVETVDEKDASEVSIPPVESNPNTKTNTKSDTNTRQIHIQAFVEIQTE